MKRFKQIAIPVFVAGVFLVPLLIGALAQGQLGRVLEIEVGKAENAKVQLKRAYDRHFKDQNPEAAIAEYQKVINHFPESPEAIEAKYRIGNIYQWDIMDSETAIQKYENLLREHPNSDYTPWALLRIGETYRRSKQADRAIDYFNQTLEKSTEPSISMQALVNKAGTLLYDLWKYSEAERVFQQIVSQYPNTDEAMEAQLRLSEIGYQHGKYTHHEVIKTCNEVLNSQESSKRTQASAQYLMGYMYYRNSEHAKAIPEFEKVLTNHPEADYDLKAETEYFIGALYEMAQDTAFAKAHYLQSVTKYPKSIWVNAVQQRLNRLANE